MIASCSIDNWFLISLLHSLVKNLSKDHFRHLSQEFDGKLLDLVKQRWFYLYEYMRYMSDFEKFKEELPSQESFACF